MLVLWWFHPRTQCILVAPLPPCLTFSQQCELGTSSCLTPFQESWLVFLYISLNIPSDLHYGCIHTTDSYLERLLVSIQFQVVNYFAWLYIQETDPLVRGLKGLSLYFYSLKFTQNYYEDRSAQMCCIECVGHMDGNYWRRKSKRCQWIWAG